MASCYLLVELKKLKELLFVNASTKELLITREEFNKMHEEFILLKQFIRTVIPVDWPVMIHRYRRTLKMAFDIGSNVFSKALTTEINCCCRWRLDEIMKIAGAIHYTMIELQRKLEGRKVIHGNKVEELELKKGIEEILEGLQGMKVD